MTAYRYWALRIDSVVSEIFISVFEIEMHGAVGGADLCTSGTAYASDNTAAAVFAFDNVLTTNYFSNAHISFPQRIWYDFGSPVSIAEFKIYSSDLVPELLIDFAIEYSNDGVTWGEAASYSGYTWNNQDIGSGVYYDLFALPIAESLDYSISVPLLTYDIETLDKSVSVPLLTVESLNFNISVPLEANQVESLDKSIAVPLLNGNIVIDVLNPESPIFGAY